MEINTEVLTQILSLGKIKSLRQIIASSIKLYSLNQKDLMNTDKRKIYLLADSLNHRKLNKSQNEHSNQKWMWGEYKLFLWIIIYYSECIGIDACSINPQSFKIIEELFTFKNRAFLLYQYHTAFPSSKNGRSFWEKEQLLMFQKLITDKMDMNQWKTISYELFKCSEMKFFKTPEECRNRWGNHNDPNLKKQPWTMQEDRKLIKSVMRVGKKWSEIGKKVCFGRTQHMTKNRYWWLINKYKINSKKLSDNQICLQILKNIGDNQPQPEKIKEQVDEEELDQMEIKKQNISENNQPQYLLQNHFGIFQSNASNSLFTEQPNELLKIDQILKVLDDNQFGGMYHLSSTKFTYNFDEIQVEQDKCFTDLDMF